MFNYRLNSGPTDISVFACTLLVQQRADCYLITNNSRVYCSMHWCLEWSLFKCKMNCLNYISLSQVFNDHSQPILISTETWDIRNFFCVFVCFLVSVSASAQKLPYRSGPWSELLISLTHSDQLMEKWLVWGAVMTVKALLDSKTLQQRY